MFLSVNNDIQPKTNFIKQKQEETIAEKQSSVMIDLQQVEPAVLEAQQGTYYVL